MAALGRSATFDWRSLRDPNARSQNTNIASEDCVPNVLEFLPKAKGHEETRQRMALTVGGNSVELRAMR